ncbi:MAG: SDR family oxidoreductase, partial [Acetobacteraceae bacterium]|nr:SDR family oxidoreductase [Acetobacteraceae bacterium]
AEAFAAEDADVVIAYHTDEQGARRTGEAVRETGRKAIVRQLDVRDQRALAELFATPITAERVNDPDKLAQATKQIPLGRSGEPREIGALAVYLASADADYVTGQSFTIDGGLEMNWGQGA